MKDNFLNISEMKILAENERRMTDGTQPFVLCRSRRWAFDRSILKDCGIVSGQVVTDIMLVTLLQMTVSMLETQIQLKEACSKSKPILEQ